MNKMNEEKMVIKTHWAEIRNRIFKLKPHFAQLVDNLSPDKSFPIYIVQYPFAALTLDPHSPFLPRQDGTFYRLGDSNTPKDIVKHLAYGKNHSPLGMILEKNFELFIDLKKDGITIPCKVYKPGDFFPFAHHFDAKNKPYQPCNSIYSCSAGSRSVFMLPNIGCSTHHFNLQRDYNFKNPAPKKIYEHWNIFKEIVKNDHKNTWRGSVIYFSHKWLEALQKNKAWAALKLFIYESTLNDFQYDLSRHHYDIAFSAIQKYRNLKPNPYLADTARHLFATAIGAAPGYAPANNNHALPLDAIQNAFLHSYGLNKYHPIVMQAQHYNFHNDLYPIYYSLQNPSTYIFSPKSRKISSTLFDIRELEHITRIFAEELADDNGMCAGSIINKISKNAEFLYFHNEPDRHNIIRPALEVSKLDNRFNYANKNHSSVFPSDAKFLRGCISIKNKSLPSKAC